MPDNKNKNWFVYILDMLRFANKVVINTKNHDFQSFVSLEIVFDATIRNLELIGEAATKVPDTIRQAHEEIPWRRIIATRNRLIHGYLGIDNQIIWSIIEKDIPILVENLGRMIEKYSSLRDREG